MKIDDNMLKLIGLMTALISAGAFIAIRISRKNSSTSNNNIINQSNNKVKNGDIIGGNKTGK